MNWIKILNFIDGVFPLKKEDLKLGNLYKIQGEDLAFRYIQYGYQKNAKSKTFHFKHHQLKEYAFKDLSKIEREATREEERIYHLIKNHINNIK